jgi:predicted nucleic acid-binding protein
MSSNFTVIYDANIFFGALRRSLMIHLAQAGIFRARWTKDIHEEWMGNLRKRLLDIRIEDLQRIRGLVDDAVPDCLVRNYQAIAKGLELPDPNDTHVLAAAIKAGAQVIVTFNKRDFPSAILEEYDIEAQHPDDFILYQKEENLGLVIEKLRQCRLERQNPPCSVPEFIQKLRANDFPLTASWVEENNLL